MVWRWLAACGASTRLAALPGRRGLGASWIGKMAATRVSSIDLRSGQGHGNAGVGRRRPTLCSHALTVTCRDYKKNFEEEFDQEDQEIIQSIQLLILVCFLDGLI